MKSIRAALCAGLALCIAACTGGGNAGRTRLVYGEQRNLQVIAEAAGTLGATPYDFEWATFATPSVQLEAFRSGATDLVSSNDITVLNALASGVDMKIVAAVQGSALQKGVGVITRGDSGIRDIAGLKGRTVVVSSARGGSGDSVLRGSLREAGLSADDVRISYAPFTDAFTAFQHGDIETWVSNDPYLYLAEQNGGRVLRNGEGINAGLVLIGASEAALADPDKRAAIADLLARLRAATLWAKAHQDEYAAAYARRNNIDPALAKAVVSRNTGELVPVTPALVAAAQKVADDMLRNGYLSRPLDVSVHFDPAVYPAETQP